MKTNIKKIFEEYIEYYPEEKENLSKLELLLEHNKDNVDNLFNRKNFEGHITASGYIYCLSTNRLLLLEHKALNKFLQPGGHVESVDDEIIDSAKREILEETGISDIDNIGLTDNYNVPFDINSHIIPKNDKKEEDEHYHHDFRYLFVIDKEEDVKLDFNESTGFKWVDIEDLLNDDKYGLTIKKIKKMINTNIKKRKLV